MPSDIPTAPASSLNAGPIIRLGEVLAGAMPFNVGNVSDTYRGVIFTEQGEQTAVIKDLEPKELANEVLAAALGIRLGLPIPPPYIALAHPDRFTARKGPTLGDAKLVYASVDVRQPHVAALYFSGGGRAVLERLAQWQALGRLYGFDALVANIDRHAGNILFSGDKEVWLIDHGQCFTGPDWQPGDLEAPDRPVRSRLTEWLTPVLDYDQRIAVADDAALVELDTKGLDFQALAVVNHVAHLLTSGDLEAVMSFLSSRRAHVPRLAASTLELERLV
ncbi:HipA family kinase [Inquilinus sp. NPDC058860]|uniref:HipA family kinase n=1 Tax=Inquilinus sp. NPDC058860 TaxID=3346652 RepID=UPI003692DF80